MFEVFRGRGGCEESVDFVYVVVWSKGGEAAECGIGRENGGEWGFGFAVSWEHLKILMMFG